MMQANSVSMPMAPLDPIFPHRTSPQDEIRPSQDQLAAFLKTATKENSEELHVTDLAKYSRLLKDTELFGQRSAAAGQPRDLGGLLFYGIMSRSGFVSQALLSAVVEFKYHLASLNSPDFTNPVAFIRSAEREKSRLNPKKIADVLRLKRLQEMIEDRKKIIAGLKKLWMPPAAELRHIAAYVKDNLAAGEKLCEAAVVILAEIDITRQRERQLVGELKTYFKDRFKEARRHGAVTIEDLDRAREEADTLALELSILIREDIDALMALYEEVRSHIKKIGADLAFLLGELDGKKGSSMVSSTDIFKQIEQTLVALISSYRFAPNPRETNTDTDFDAIIHDKRWTMMTYLLEEVQKERRTGEDRRTLPDRRTSTDPTYTGTERRSDKQRRAGKIRRQ
jgi:hypothetical protein